MRAIVGAPVVVQSLGSFAPTVRNGTTISNCTYGLPNGSTGAKVTLTWGPHEKLVQFDQFYGKRHKESPSIKGDVFVLTAVLKGGTAFDYAAGQKLLAAALAKL
ncbi:MAG: hypothetical protein M3169_00330 [Candidatus Eremiobacteraeota bacterium]|nr:hypothetical protein [Candidatus Eremiobacteraeota bacterium]